MAVAYDNSATAQQNTSSGLTLTFSLTVGSGAHRYLAVFAAMDDTDTAPNVSGATYNGDPLTFLDTQAVGATTQHQELWVMASPDTGTHDVVITIPSAGSGSNALYGAAIAAQSADGAISISGSVVKGTGSGTVRTLTIPAAAGDLVVAGQTGNTGGTVVSPGVERTSVVNNIFLKTLTIDVSSGPSVVASWDTNAFWSMIGVALTAEAEAAEASGFSQTVIRSRWRR